MIQRAIAGLDKVVNERPTTRASVDETDEELRARAQAALIAANKGTVESITHGLLQLPQVRDVKVEEMPNGVPGEIRISVSLAEPTGQPDELPQEVTSKIEELRPAGVRVVTSNAKPTSVQIAVQLVLAGSSLPAAELQQVHNSVRDLMKAELQKKVWARKFASGRLSPRC